MLQKKLLQRSEFRDTRNQYLYPENYGPALKAIDGWVKRFMKCNNVVYRAATSVGQKVPQDSPERCDLFHDETKNL